jgi:anti-sigma factor RsiW
MIECRQSQALGAYHDGELAAPSRAALEEHLGACPVCAAELERLEKMSRLIRAAERPEMPREVLDRLHRSVDLQPRITMLHVAEVCAAIAASILLVSTVWLWRVSAAREAGPIPLWETAAVAPQDPSGVAAQEQLAQWIVQDLSRKNGHD